MLVAAARSRYPQVASGTSLGVGVVLVLAAAIGFINHLQLLSIDSAVAADNFLHLITGLVAIGFGLAGNDVTFGSRTGAGTRQTGTARA